MLKPKHSGNYPDRDIDCQEAVVTEIMALIESAKNAGWEEAETATAIAVVARGLVTGFLNDAQDE